MVVEVGIWVETQVKSDLYFPLWAWQNGSCKEGWEKGRSVTVVVTRQYAINIHKHVHGVGFKNCAPQALRSVNLPRRRRELQINWAKGISKECAILYLGAIVQKM